jgi:putative endonuclease
MDGYERTTTGRAAELAVAHYLELRGYSIVASNLRIGYLELDLVARLGPVIAIVEVRSRGASAWTSGFGSIDRKKRLRIRRAGQRLWQRRYKHDSSVERLRFDAASVTWVDGRACVSYAAAAF